MATTVTRFKPGGLPYRIVGNQREVQADVQMGASYQEGGEPISPEEVGLNVIHSAICQIRTGTESEEYVGEASYSVSEGKLHLINVKTGKEVEGGKNMSKVNIRIIARGW